MNERLPLTRIAEIEQHLAATTNWSLGNLAARDLLAELYAVRAELRVARGRVAELAAVRAEREESQRYAALLEVELCQCEPLLETGEYMHEATCPVVEIQMRTLGCPGFEGNPVAPDLCAGCHEPRENHASASQDGVS